MIWMALSNEEGHLVLACGNKSELATGYSTMYGDAVGGYAPIKDVPKTLVWALARWRNEQAAARGQTPPIPENSITKPPSAELAPGQLDSDSLPDYEVLDRLLDDYVEQDMGSRRAGRGGPRPGAGRARHPAGRPGRVQAAAVPAGPEDLRRRTSAGTGGCRSRAAGASPGPADRRGDGPAMGLVSRAGQPDPARLTGAADPGQTSAA